MKQLLKTMRRKFTERGTGASRPGRSRWADALHVFVLTSFAIAQPFYDRLGERGGFLADKEVRAPAILILVLIVSLLLPAILVVLENLAAYVSKAAYEMFHAILVFVLLLLIAIPAVKRIEAAFSGSVVLCLAILAAVFAAWSYFEFRKLRQAVSLASPGIVIFPAAFLFSSSVTGILFPPTGDRAVATNPVPVVLLVLDEFSGSTLMNPSREIDADRFPNFAALAQQSTWFRNATAVHSDTHHAVPAILSGKYPSTTWAPVPADLQQNVFSVLESTGQYELAAFEPITYLAPHPKAAHDLEAKSLGRQMNLISEALWRIYLFHVTPSEYWRHLPAISREWFGFRAFGINDRTRRRGVFRYDWDRNRDERFEHFLDCLTENSNPTVYFCHLLLPHVNWSYLPSGRQYLPDLDDRDLLSFDTHSGILDLWNHDDHLVSQGQQRYLLQLQFVDRLVGKMIERLKSAGLFDRSLLIVTADHGVAFRADQPRRLTSPENLADILSVPLFVKRPFQMEGSTSDRRVESVDILPTVADITGIRLRRPTDGWSVFEEPRKERDRITFIHEVEKREIDPAVVIQSDVPQVIRRRFGDSGDPGAMFRIGPVPELIGRTIDSFERSAEQSVEIEPIRFQETFDDSEGAIAPCFFEGYVRPIPLAGQPLNLAVAVNGTIQTVTRTYVVEGLRDRWAAMVPESAFQPGTNDVRFFALTRTGRDSHWRISPCRVRSSTP
jgi:hypothetical protein